MIMGDEEAASQQSANDEKQAGTAGSIYGGDPAPAQPPTEDDPDSTGSIGGGEPEGDEPGGDDDGPPDDGSIYGG